MSSSTQILPTATTGPMRRMELPPRNHGRSGGVVLALVLALLVAGSSGSTTRTTTTQLSDCSQLERQVETELTQDFLEHNTNRYHTVIKSARHWFDMLEVDPFVLRTHGIKGKKKLVELLMAYYDLYQVVAPEDRPSLLDRVREVVAITYEPQYHDMLQIDDKQFKQDATSYLRAPYLMEQLGLDTRLYREEIRKVHSRLNAHMTQRGSHQRMAFHWYYDHFGLDEPFPLANAFDKGVIATRLDLYEFTRRTVYDLTHEIFIPFEYGEKIDSDFFDSDDRLYLRRIMDRLVVYYIMRDDPDLVAELVSCMVYLRVTDLPTYREAVGYLLKSQRPEGKWGDFERYRNKYGQFVDQGFYLHTTLAVTQALTNAFESN